MNEKTRHRKIPVLALTLLVSWAMFGCEIEDLPESEELLEVDEASQALFLEGPEIGLPWPTSNNTTYIPICFREMGTIDSDRQGNEYMVGYYSTLVFTRNPYFSHVDPYTAAQFEEKKQLVEDILKSSWAKWSRVVYTGFGMCPNDIRGMVYVDLIRSRDGNFGGDCLERGYHPHGSRVWLRMDTPNEYVLRSTIIHEFGHSLGFHHEMDRPDAVAPDGSFLCNDGPITYFEGTALTDYYDQVSIMDYCAPLGRNGLSFGDITGVQSIYGRSREGDWLRAMPSLISLL